MAVEDFLAGPQILHDGGTGAAAAVRKLRAEYPETTRHPAHNVPGIAVPGIAATAIPVTAADPTPSRPLLVLAKRLVRQLLRKPRSTAVISARDSHWWHVSRFQTAVVTEPSQQGVRVRRLDQAQIRRLGGQGLRVLAQRASSAAAPVPGCGAAAGEPAELATALRQSLRRVSDDPAPAPPLRCSSGADSGAQTSGRELARLLNLIRAAVRIRLVRVVDEVVSAHRRELEATLTTHHRELAVALAAHRHEMRAALDAHRHEMCSALTAEVDRAVQAVRDVEYRSQHDLMVAGERAAVASSARFAEQVMPTVPTFADPIATLEHALSLAPAEGLALEFGVATGGTLRVIAAARGNKQVFGFDSFQGLPEDWRTNLPAGTFKTDGLPEVPGAELVVGLFADTLPGFLAGHADPVAFLHLDADLYSSTVTVLEHVGPRLRPGSVIAFDEYFNYPGWEQHEHRAWQEFVAASGIEFDYLAYTCDHEQVVIMITKT